MAKASQGLEQFGEAATCHMAQAQGPAGSVGCVVGSLAETMF